MEPNISPWRRAVCGDLTTCFDFHRPSRRKQPPLPQTAALAARAKALPKRTTPATPAAPEPPVQAAGVRPSRALPYELDARIEMLPASVAVSFVNTGPAAAVFHVYDLHDLAALPRRYTVEGGLSLEGNWPRRADGHDLWVLGPNGFHRRFRAGAGAGPSVAVGYDRAQMRLTLTLGNGATTLMPAAVTPKAYQAAHASWPALLQPGASETHAWSLERTGGWYDLAVTAPNVPGWLVRLAGRLETGRDSITDPAMHGEAVMVLT
jgi:phospholipase C